MKVVATLGLSLLFSAPATFAQDASKPDTDSKSERATKEGSKASELAERQQRVQSAERELRDAQQAFQKAQREVQKAQRDAQNSAREQIAAARAKQKTAPMQRVIINRAGGDVRSIFRSGTSPLLATHGMDLTEADAVLRAQLGLPADQGLVVTQVIEKRLADQAGVKLNDVLVKLDEKPVGKVAQIQEILIKKGNHEIELIREGKPRKVSVSGLEQGSPDTATNYWIGVPVAPVDATLRSHLAALPKGAGLIATDVVSESPAAKAGIKKNDILIKFNGQDLGNQEALIEQVQKSAGKESKVEVLRAGKVEVITMTPEKRKASPYGTVSATFDLGSGPQVFTFGGPAMGEMSRLPNLGPAGDLSARIVGEMNNSLKGLDGKALEMLKLDGKLDAELQQQMKALTGQLEELRKAIEEIKKSVPAGKEPKAGVNDPTAVMDFLTLNPGAFW